MKVLLSYGTHAKVVIPELTKIADYFEKDEKNFPKEMTLMKVNCVRETIRAIQASTDSPKLIRLAPPTSIERITTAPMNANLLLNRRQFLHT